ncbi:hypothetical protein [Veillonella sp.]|nr:hypothetical protein [Veillonella sp.]
MAARVFHGAILKVGIIPNFLKILRKIYPIGGQKILHELNKNI